MTAVTRKIARAPDNAVADKVSEDLRNLTIEITTGKISRSEIADRVYKASERFEDRYGRGNQPAGSLQARVQKRINDAVHSLSRSDLDAILKESGMSGFTKYLANSLRHIKRTSEGRSPQSKIFIRSCYGSHYKKNGRS